ncbi:MAG: FTR1 family protein [Candidatus Omnitrophica bacterium]|nr:FTR1 family protein [Candidatus Omnitrophota bacterium]
MFSIGVIIFREVLEIAIILTTLLAATKGLTGRNKWIIYGLLGGVLGSCVVAYFAEAISSFAEGVGQEIFNAGILIAAAALIGWTVVWMRRHGRELAEHLKEVGRAVTSGEKPLYSLAFVIMLAVLREGSEIVLFTFSAVASGEAIIMILVGSLLGLAAGAGLGMAMYFGMVRVPTRYLFSVTSWLLVFLAAGMVSQAAGLLQAGGILPVYISQLWDSSNILSEQSIIGSFLHTLVGYSSRPSFIQVVSYVCSFAVITAFLVIYGNKSRVLWRKAVVGAMVFLGILMLPQAVHATKKVYSPIVHGGELEFEWKGSYDIDNRDDKDGKQKQKFGIGYGAKDWWFTEVEAEIEREALEEEYDFKALEWENKFQLTEQGEYFLDFGFLFAYETTVNEKAPDKIEGKFLFEKSFEQFVHTANIIFEKQVGGGAEEETEAGFAWSTRYLEYPVPFE